MAIRGAFAAGAIEAFGKGFAEDIKERTSEYNKFLDQQLTKAKSAAPAFAKSNADVQQQVELMDVFDREFGISNTEFVALAQNYDIKDLYSTFAAHKQALPESVQLRKEDLLSVLDIKEDSAMQLPEGMTPEQALRAAALGYVNNVSSDPTDKSEGNKNRSWAKSIADTLMLNPRVRADDAIKQMQVMGIPVDDLLTYQAAQMNGAEYDPIAGVGRATGVLGDLKSDYKVATDYESAQGKYRAELTRNFSNGMFDDTADIPEDAVGNISALLQVDKTQDTQQQRAALGQAMARGGRSFAELELQLLRKGYYEGFNTNDNRASALLALSSQIDTRNELDAFNNAVLDGSLADLIVAEGAVTDAVLEKLFNPEGTPEEEKPEDTPEEEKPEQTQTEELISEPVVEEVVTESGPTLNNADIVQQVVENEPVEEPEEKAAPPANLGEFVISEYGQNLLNYLIDEEELTSADSAEDVMGAVASWFSDNAANLNVGAGFTAQDVTRIMMQVLKNLDEQ